MKKTKKIVSLMLCCVMLLGVTLSASAANYPYNKGPCPHCNTPNSGEFKYESDCGVGYDFAGYYRCGKCGGSFGFCHSHGIF